MDIFSIQCEFNRPVGQEYAKEYIYFYSMWLANGGLKVC